LGVLAKAKYGLPTATLPKNLFREIHHFKVWETNGVQLDRGGVYAKKVQQPTMESHQAIIKAFMGFTATAFKVDKRKLALALYQQADIFLSFISFLIQRDVSRGHILHHITLANKINSYLQSKATNPKHIQHCNRITSWLNILSTQISNIVAMPQKTAPPLEKIWEWVDSLNEGAMQVVNGMMPDCMQVQAAIVASMVTGREMPPCRLSILKTAIHPSAVVVGGCSDPDCTIRGCKGNRFEVIRVPKETKGGFLRLFVRLPVCLFVCLFVGF
jgi:hypothetical protein